MNYYFLNEDRTYSKCNIVSWGTQFESIDRHLANDIVNGYRISTVWLGIDHNFNLTPNSRPLLFETMIFEGQEMIELYVDRYTTWDEAIEGHKKAIQWLDEAVEGYKKAIQWVKDGCKDDAR